MKKHDNETYEQWLERAREYEYLRALSNLARGQNIDQVLQDLSNRLVAKALDPLLKELKKQSIDK